MKTEFPIAALQAWYHKNARRLPWRKARPNPYHVWLSEIMLQQTVVATVIPYFETFTRKWKDLHALAAAAEEEVMTAWAGLGYYARARNMLKCARIIVQDYDGKLPQQESELIKLPGIGSYTAAAIAAIAFDQPTAPVDGNIERVLARVFADQTPLPALKANIKDYARQIYPPQKAGIFAQALMDLGATICTPKSPSCAICPCQNKCAAHAQNIAASLPRRAAKKEKPIRRGAIYWLENQRGQVLLRQRPDKGLLGGMLEFPSIGWDTPNDCDLPALCSRLSPQDWCAHNDEIIHVFTHFRLQLKLYKAIAPKGFRKPPDCLWADSHEFAALPLPSLMQKVIRQCA